MLRKVKSIGGQVHPTGQGKKRRAVMRFARRLLQLKKESVPQQLKVRKKNRNFCDIYTFVPILVCVRVRVRVYIRIISSGIGTTGGISRRGSWSRR